MTTSFRPRRRRLGQGLTDDPFALLVNFFDCSIVFALGFIVALLARSPAPERAKDAAARAATAAKDVAAALKRRMKPSAETATGPGERLGVAYRLPNGDVVYVPDGTKPAPR